MSPFGYGVLMPWRDWAEELAIQKPGQFLLGICSEGYFYGVLAAWQLIVDGARRENLQGLALLCRLALVTDGQWYATDGEAVFLFQADGGGAEAAALAQLGFLKIIVTVRPGCWPLVTVDSLEDGGDTRGCRLAADESGGGVSVLVAEPDSQSVVRRVGEAPGVVVAIGGASLPS